MAGIEQLSRVQERSWKIVETGCRSDEALLAMCEAVGRLTAATTLADPFTRDVRFVGGCNIDPALHALVRERFNTPENNPILRAMIRAKPFELYHGRHYYEPSELIGTAYHEQFMKPAGITDGGGLLHPTPDGRVVCATVGCLDDRPWFDARDGHFIELSLTTIARAVRAMALVSYERAIERLKGMEPDPAFLLSQAGTIYLANTAGERLLGEADGVRRRRGRLLPRLEKDDHAFETRLNDIRAGRRSSAMAIESDGRYTRLVFEPGPQYRDDRTILVSVRHARVMEWTIERLQECFDLTKREAEVAILLSRGLRTERIAQDLSLSGGSVRIYLKRIFAKTGTGAQAELVAKLLRARMS